MQGSIRDLRYEVRRTNQNQQMGLGSQNRQAVAVQGTLGSLFTASDSPPCRQKKKIRKKIGREEGRPARSRSKQVAVMSRAINPPLATEFFA